LGRPLVCFNLFHLIREMDRIPANTSTVRLNLTDDVSIIDHTSCENLFHYLEQFNSQDDRPKLEIRGFDVMRGFSNDHTSIRVANRQSPSGAPLSSELHDVSPVA
jgi:hypothetical protein